MSLTKETICNLALGHLGSKSTILDIENPKKSEEIVFSQRYDIVRQKALKMIKPNFALKRALLARLDETPVFGFSYVYLLPSDSLSLLGIGNIEDKENNYTIENNRLYIDDNYEDGLPVRYVQDYTDTTKFTPEFVELLSWELAKNCCMAITQSKEMLSYITQIMPRELSSASAMNAQENRMIRISNSRFKASRYSNNPRFEVKK